MSVRACVCDLMHQNNVLVRTFECSNSLVFCLENKRTRLSRRLCLLTKQFDGDRKVEEFSSSLHAKRRARILKRFTAGQIDM